MGIWQLMSWVFWIGIAEALYAYLVFPSLAAMMARRAGGSRRIAEPASADVATVVIPAFNEEQSIEAKIRNVLASDYPAACLDVIVVRMRPPIAPMNCRAFGRRRPSHRAAVAPGQNGRRAARLR
jgi:cellulose synthase/poly-beta-1,6-N-acetylglucosamine synthase-like glycosyltransferase